MSTLHITVKLTGEVKKNDGTTQLFDREVKLSLNVQPSLGSTGNDDMAEDTIAALKGYLGTTLQDAIDLA